MSVRDQSVVYCRRQIREGVALYLALVLVANDRIKQQAHLFRLDEQTSMPQITYTHSFFCKRTGFFWLLLSEEGVEHALQLLIDREMLLDMRQRLGNRFHLEKLVQPWALEGNSQRQPSVGLQSRCAEDEGPAIAIGLRKRYGLR